MRNAERDYLADLCVDVQAARIRRNWREQRQRRSWRAKAFLLAAVAGAVYMANVAAQRVDWRACVAVGYCADETFETLRQCEEFNAVTPYGHEATCEVVQ